ncbi:MAG: hypothetical protein A3J83_08405 [Elusimicrobia bacterium RIFOXYA2_FULL_40_6]|nr:MAG: hypothetical protein A3J83_08405 [Elusimicrobia bacterium RIFOXYA2_FULL_40_6]
MLALFIILPLFGAFIIFLTGKYSKNVSYIMGWIVPALLSALSLMLAGTKEVLRYNIGGWAPPLGINLVADGLSIFFLVIINLIVLLAAIFSIPYIEKYTSKWIYFALLLVMHASMNAAVLTADIFNLFIWIEIGGVASYALVAYGVEPEELEASFKYAVLSSVGLLFILLGIGLLYAYTSTLNMQEIGRILQQKPTVRLLNFVMVLFLVGAGLKAAIVPFHSWLPDAHSSAPSPVSALLSGVLIKALGIYVLLRVMYNVFGMTAQMNMIFIILGLTSIIVGGVLAIYQNDMKRLLAYSTISQVGYIIFAFGLGTPLGIFAGLFHLVNHAFAKTLMFLNAGSVVYATNGERDMNKLGGLREKMPITAATALVGSMSISGIPPFGGFWSKLVIIIAAIQAGHYFGALIAVLISIVTLSYYLKLQKNVFFGELKTRWANVKESPWMMCFSLMVLSIICVGLGALLIPDLKSIFLDPAVKVLTDGLK